MRRPIFLIALLLLLAASATSLSADPDDDEASPLIATGDFNRDGIADMVEVTQPQAQGPHLLTLLLGQPNGSYTAVPAHDPIGKDPRALVVDDFNGDGKLDVIVGDASGALLEFTGDGHGNIAPAGNAATLGSVASLAVGHFTHNRHLDLVVSDFHSNSAAILLGAGDGTFHLAWSFSLPKAGTQYRISTADFNQDGIADLVITTQEDENYEVMLGNGNGTFTYAPTLSHLKDPNSYCPS